VIDEVIIILVFKLCLWAGWRCNRWGPWGGSCECEYAFLFCTRG